MALVWAVTGAQFTADSARAETFKSTNGSRGVTLPDDLKVSALPTPGAFVRVGPGGATLPAGYPSAPGQSYGTYQSTTVQVPVAATGSGGGATKYLIQRITDPQFEGTAPANPTTAVYDSYAWVSSLSGLNYPYVPLAKLVQPASTATITNAMLTDIRELTNPRSVSYTFMSGPTPEKSPADGGSEWPDYRPLVKIPAWANHVSMVTSLASMGHRGGNTAGQITTTLGSGTWDVTMLRAANAGYDLDAAVNSGQRHTFIIGGAGAIPAGMRGNTVPLGVEANREAGPGYLVTVRGTQVIYQVTFTERI